MRGSTCCPRTRTSRRKCRRTVPADRSHFGRRRDGEHEGAGADASAISFKEQGPLHGAGLGQGSNAAPKTKCREAEEPACYGGVHAARMTSSSFGDAGRRYELRTACVGCRIAAWTPCHVLSLGSQSILAPLEKKAVFKGRRRRIQAASGRFRPRLEGCVLRRLFWPSPAARISLAVRGPHNTCG